MDTLKNIQELGKRRKALHAQYTEALKAADALRSSMGEAILDGASPATVGGELAALEATASAIKAALGEIDSRLSVLGADLRVQQAEEAAGEIDELQQGADFVFRQLVGSMASAAGLADELLDNYKQAAKIASAHSLPAPRMAQFFVVFDGIVRPGLREFLRAVKLNYREIYDDAGGDSALPRLLASNAPYHNFSKPSLDRGAPITWPGAPGPDYTRRRR